MEGRDRSVRGFGLRSSEGGYYNRQKYKKGIRETVYCMGNLLVMSSQLFALPLTVHDVEKVILARWTTCAYVGYGRKSGVAAIALKSKSRAFCLNFCNLCHVLHVLRHANLCYLCFSAT